MTSPDIERMIMDYPVEASKPSDKKALATKEPGRRDKLADASRDRAAR